MTKHRLIIIGSGGLAKSILDSALNLNNLDVFGFIDEQKKRGIKINGVNVVGKIKDIIKLNKQNKINCFIVGVGDNYLRKKINDQIMNLKIKNFKPISIIDKSAQISTFSTIGRGSYIAPKVVIQTSVKIGNGCLINMGSIIDHDNSIGQYSSTAPGCVTGGNVNIGKLCHLALSSVIKNNISIGNNTIIGSNSYVNKDCKSFSIYFGNPTKFFRKRTLGEKYL